MELLRRGPRAPIPRECYIQYGECDRTGFDPLGTMLAFIPAPSAKNFSFFTICTK